MKCSKNILPLGPLLLAVVSITVSSVGCYGGRGDSPELAQVNGIVTIDGKPMEHIEVLFQPTADAASSRGMTDADGKFTVYYPPDIPGAVPGKHRVQFDLKDADRSPDIVPPKYRFGSPGIEVDVVSEGSNEFEFELKK